MLALRRTTRRNLILLPAVGAAVALSGCDLTPIIVGMAEQDCRVDAPVRVDASRQVVLFAKNYIYTSPRLSATQWAEHVQRYSEQIGRVLDQTNDYLR
jgi:hypothetical protein